MTRSASYTLAVLAWALSAPGWADAVKGAEAAGAPQPAAVLTGLFRYEADAATITLCADGRRLPVAMEGEYRALEAAYLAARREPGQPLRVRLEGRIEPRPSAEAGRPPQDSLVVERFIELSPSESCGVESADLPLRGTRWTLVRLGDTPVQASEPERAPHLIFAVDELRVSGSGGCNRVTGSFELEGDELHLDRLASTMMACPSGMEQEQRFLGSMQKVERYGIRGRQLELRDAAGAVIARFEASPQR